MNRKKMLVTIIAFLLVIALLLPIVILLNTSLQTYDQIRSWPPQWFDGLQWQNYGAVLVGDNNILRPFLNSLFVATITMLLCVVIGVLAAYALSRYQFLGNKSFLVIVILTQMFSPVILVTPMYIILRQLGLLDTLVSLIAANTASALPMTIWLLYSYFSQVTMTYEEAAWMDGSSRLQAIKNILIPIALPGIITGGLFAFVAAWGDLVYVRTFITSAELRTISLALTDFQDLYKTAWETQMAASVVSSLPTIFIFLIIQKHLIRGISAQGLKS